MNTVNGKPVEYIYVQKTRNGYEIIYSDKFNIVTAHMSCITEKLREYNIHAQVFKRIDKGIILIQLYDMEDLSIILNILRIPTGAWELVDDIIVVDISEIN